jgi:hypothetical protein
MSPRADITYMNLLNDMLSLLRTHRARKGWLVALCPSDTVTISCAHILAALVPAGTKFSGRTALFPGGKLSVACVTDPVFPPSGAFAVSFMGWEVTDNPAGAAQWRNQAGEILSGGVL